MKRPYGRRARRALAGFGATWTSVLALSAAAQASAADPASTSAPAAPQAPPASTTATAPSAPAQSGPSSTQSAALQEIVVTANKRQQNINKVGATITAITPTELQERRIVSLADIASVVPSLDFAQSVYNTPILTLRGVGFNSPTLGSFPAVSGYLDQAPMPFPVYLSHTTYDLERVEVLKGPQGTLFGESSTGGAVNFVAAKPTRTPEAGGDISYGRFNDVLGNAYVSGPITDKLLARVAVTGESADGWQESVTRPDDRLGHKGYLAGRLLLDWTPTEKIHFLLDVNGWRDESQPQAGQFAGLYPGTGSAFGVHAEEFTTPFSAGNPRSADWPSGPVGDLTSPADLDRVRPRSDRNFGQASLRSDFDLAEGLTLTSLTTYEQYQENVTPALDGTDLDIITVAPIIGRLSTVNQEVRLSNEKQAHSPVRWIVGGNYERDVMDEDENPIFLNDSTNNPAFFNVSEDFQDTYQHVDQYSAFANVDADLTSRITGKAGVRYTNILNRASLCAGGDQNGAALTNVLSSAIYGPGHVTAFAGPPGCTFLTDDGNVQTSPVKGRLSEDNVSWHAGVDYKISSDALAYVNVSKGFKAGSFPDLSFVTVSETVPVRQESVIAYEAGAKVSFLDRKIHVNAAFFYNDYYNKQVLGLVPSATYGLLKELSNAPRSDIYGVDTDISFHPFRGLTIDGAATYLQSRIDKYSGYNAISVATDFTGDRLPFVPTWDFSLNADYRYELGNGGAPFVGVSVEGKSGMDTQVGGGETTLPNLPYVRDFDNRRLPFTTNFYETLDLRAGYEAPGGAWKAMVYGKNILDKYYWTNADILGDAITRFAGAPATYGVTVSFRFR